MSLLKRIKVALNLSKKSIAEKVEFARIVISEMTGNANFGAVVPINPPLVDIGTVTDELEQAAIDAAGGGTEETAIMYEKEYAYNTKLTALGHYVEDVANENPETAESVVLSAGMEVKSHSDPLPNLPQPENLKGEYAKKVGGVKLSSDTVKGARVYCWIMSRTPNDPSSFMVKEDFTSITTKSEFEWTGLDSGKLYAFQVFVVGASGRSPLSDVMVHRAS
jgi:hypothetical protein